MTCYPTDCLTDRLTVLRTDWVTYRMTDWLTDWLNIWLTDALTHYIIMWMTGWLTDSLTEWLTKWASDRLTEWLTEVILRARATHTRAYPWDWSTSCGNCQFFFFPEERPTRRCHSRYAFRPTLGSSAKPCRPTGIRNSTFRHLAWSSFVTSTSPWPVSN